MKFAGFAFGAVLALTAMALLLRDGADGGAWAKPQAWPAADTAIGRTGIGSVGRQRELPAARIPQPESLPTADTTGLLDQSLSIDELLDRVDADTGEDFNPVDREQLATVLRSDPEIRKAMGD